MKRNMDLIRTLLLCAEGDEAAMSECSKFERLEQAYHVQLLVDAGLVDAIIQKDHQGVASNYHVFRLTWAGHEFIDSMRQDTLWRKAKEHVLKPGASWTFDILKEWAKAEIKQQLGIPAAP